MDSHYCAPLNSDLNCTILRNSWLLFVSINQIGIDITNSIEPFVSITNSQIISLLPHFLYRLSLFSFNTQKSNGNNEFHPQYGWYQQLFFEIIQYNPIHSIDKSLLLAQNRVNCQECHISFSNIEKIDCISLALLFLINSLFSFLTSIA